MTFLGQFVGTWFKRRETAVILLMASSQQAVCALAGAFAVVTLIHAVETGKFVSAWTDYRQAIAALAMGEAIAHLNYLMHGGRVVRETGTDGILRFVQAS